MVQTMNASSCGETFRPEDRVELQPNTKVRLAVRVPESSGCDTSISAEFEG